VEVDEKHHSVIQDVVKATDLDLFLDGNFLVISIGLAFVYAVSIDFSNILPGLLSVRIIFSFLLLFKLFLLHFRRKWKWTFNRVLSALTSYQFRTY
jgi:hypothetical protein